MNELMRAIPSISDVLSDPAAVELMAAYPRWAVRNAARELIDSERRRFSSVAGQGVCSIDVQRQDVLARVVANLPSATVLAAAPGPRYVINATGIVLHTNLGRAPLPEYAARAVAECAMGYSDLEYDLEGGGRGSRQDHIARAMAELTGAPAAYVVNNNAAAVLLCLDTLARGRKVLVSRGELVEIGGSFRVPDIMERSGATLVEVGTTNRTRLSDYRRAIDLEAGLLLKVHTSNFRVMGFTEEVQLAELVELGRECGLPVMYDLGSGLVSDLGRFGLHAEEPTVIEAVASGADLVTFSGDKLFGGPQAGIILGREDLIRKISVNPLARALRIDKLTLSALAAVAAAWENPDDAGESIPVLSMLTQNTDELRERAASLMGLIEAGLDEREIPRNLVDLAIVDDPSEAGGGSMPTVSIPGASVSVTSRCIPADQLQTRLRRCEPPVVARIAEGSVRFHMRTLFERDLKILAEHVCDALASPATFGGDTDLDFSEKEQD
ncbi:MAG TPA: L-seryl-tRNA(Sec) selenium transferase [Bacillota bacterium]|nr:L-seryl-tRNA(Sec) selenium transferase [Bacillota bacterium]HPZ14372.1 L-seryl-tRNA(Sec) selenium transferase [Bacillota bacterium]